MGSNYYILSATLYLIKAINQFHFLVVRAHYIFYNFFRGIFHYVPKKIFSHFIFALQIDLIFPMCVCMLSKIKFSHSNIIPIYYCGIRVAQDRRGGSNWLQIYLALGGCELGLNWHRGRDMVMMQSVLTVCASYIIQTNCQLTAAHYFTMEKCVNVHKFPTKKCDDVSEYSHEKCE